MDRLLVASSNSISASTVLTMGSTTNSASPRSPKTVPPGAVRKSSPSVRSTPSGTASTTRTTLDTAITDERQPPLVDWPVPTGRPLRTVHQRTLDTILDTTTAEHPNLAGLTEKEESIVSTNGRWTPDPPSQKHAASRCAKTYQLEKSGNNAFCDPPHPTTHGRVILWMKIRNVTFQPSPDIR